jgi:hypothetical protein
LRSEDLEGIWARVERPHVAGEIAGLRPPEVPAEVFVYLGLDTLGRKHLLVQLPEDSEPLPRSNSRGLEVRTERLRVGDSREQLYANLICLESSVGQTFVAVCEEILRGLARIRDDPRGQVVRSLERWRWFWSTDPQALSAEAALGLFAELWFLDRWLGTGAASVARWTAPWGGRHDFQWPEASVEVKATTSRGVAGPVHTVSTLDQLEEPPVGALYLFSLQAAEDALASNTLPRLVSRITKTLEDQGDGIVAFVERLAQANYHHAHAERYQRPLRVVAEELFRVEGEFPRLTRRTFPSGPPPGISGISYALSLSACRPWRVATAPNDSGAVFLRS